MAKRRIRSLSGIEELGQVMADAVDGPVVTCVEYKKGKKGKMRCARFEPTQGVIDPEFPYKVKWNVRNKLRKPNVYTYDYKGVYRRAVLDKDGNVKVYTGGGRGKKSKKK